MTTARKRAAIKAYFAWMPIREFAYRPKSSIYRAFRYGDLASARALFEQHEGRDGQFIVLQFNPLAARDVIDDQRGARSHDGRGPRLQQTTAA